jgi:thioesterase domain-containing protein
MTSELVEKLKAFSDREEVRAYLAEETVENARRVIGMISKEWTSFLAKISEAFHSHPDELYEYIVQMVDEGRAEELKDQAAQYLLYSNAYAEARKIVDPLERKASPGRFRAFSGEDYIGEYPTQEMALRAPTHNQEVFVVYDDQGKEVGHKQHG